VEEEVKKVQEDQEVKLKQLRDESEEQRKAKD